MNESFIFDVILKMDILHITYHFRCSLLFMDINKCCKYNSVIVISSKKIILPPLYFSLFEWLGTFSLCILLYSLLEEGVW